MRLYYYTAKQWGLKILWEKRLKIAQYANLNDPFELIPFDLSDKESRNVWRSAVTALSIGHGVLCFSESWTSTLMWAHYGDKHAGLCLGFEIEDGPHLTKIDYVDSRLPCPIDKEQELAGINSDVLEKALNHKHSGWAYEKEHRLRVSLQDKRDGNFYYNFNSAVRLREVIIGAQSTLSIIDVAEAIGNEPEDDVEIWTARPAFQTFSLCRNEARPHEIIAGFTDSKKHSLALAAELKRRTALKP